jgi:hypothetical protein
MWEDESMKELDREIMKTFKQTRKFAAAVWITVALACLVFWALVIVGIVVLVKHFG